MCTPVHTPTCTCSHMCGCMNTLSIEDEITMLESGKQRIQVQMNMMERRIEELKKKV